jgi:O-antigen ligase
MNVASRTATPPSRIAMASYDETNPIQMAGFFLLQGFIFLSCSRLSDLFLAPLHLPLIFSSLALICMLLSGGLHRALSTTPGKLLIAFTVWMVLILPFSTWKGGSFLMLKESWSRSILSFLLVAGLTVSLDNCRRLMIALMLGSTVGGLIALVKNFRPGGRLALPTGLFANSNDMAQVMLLALPFAALLWGKGMLKSLGAVMAAFILLFTILGSGSRSALLSVGVIAFFVFLRASAVQRLLIVAALFVGVVLTAAIIPRATLMRYATIFGGTDAVQVAESEEEAAIMSRNASAVESSESRKKLFFRSIELTIRNPLLGVGPGVFQIAATDLSHEKGERAMWLESHNTYTQVSSETGIPGALLYIGVVVSCFLSILKLEKAAVKAPRQKEFLLLSRVMLFALTGFAVTSFFSSVAYKFMFPTVLGMAVALVRAGQLHLRAVAQQTSAPDPKPAPNSVRPRLPVRPAWQTMNTRSN